MIVKMDPKGVVKMDLGRKPEAIDYLERFIERGEKDTDRFPVGGAGTFGRPTDVTWDTQDNIYVSDGYNNSRVRQALKDGTWVKAIGTRGTAPNSSTPCTASRPTPKQIYVADRGNRRIQVYDAPDAFKTTSPASARRGALHVDAEVPLQRRRQRQDLPAR